MKIVNTPDPKSHSRERFSQYAQGYVNSRAHSDGSDLDDILRLAAPEPDWIALDIATGGGHTALKLAPHVGRMIASDYAPVMLDAARAFLIDRKGLTNVDFIPADAEALPFRAGMFDLITCRIAAHHFPDVFRFMLECARTLKPGGTLIVQDQALPDSREDAAYVEAFEKLRDPSHVRALPVYEWQGAFLDAGLTVDDTLLVTRDAPMVEWAERQGCTPEVIEHLHILMIQAPEPVAKWMNIRCAGTADAIFDHTHVIVKGTKV
ncbi:MAG: class I SAM-dependent methyltransferase [Chloroflexi bacterium]|nr:class I SAM-dependent methyltransferase [Chloroflexota bacterium]